MLELYRLTDRNQKFVYILCQGKMADILHVKIRYKAVLAKILSYIADCQLVSYMPLTVLAVNYFGMSSGGNAKSPIFGRLLIASILNDKYFGTLLQLL